MSNQISESKQFACPKCGEPYEPPLPDDLHTIATLTPPSDASNYIETPHECVNCQYVIRLYWLEGNLPQPRKQTTSPRTEALLRHRNRLNQSVFKPLREYIGSSGGSSWDSAKYHFSLDEVMSSPYLPDARQHLEIDLPRYTSEISTVELSARKLDTRVEKFKKAVERKIESELSTIAQCSRDWNIQVNAVYLPNVLNIIESNWFLILYRYLQSKNALKTVIKKLENHHPPRRESDGSLWLGGTGVGRLPSERDEEKLIQAIDTLSRDVKSVRRIIRYAGQKGILQSKVSELSQLIDTNIIHPIEDEQYKTIAKCCKRVMEAVEGSEEVEQ